MIKFLLSFFLVALLSLQLVGTAWAPTPGLRNPALPGELGGTIAGDPTTTDTAAIAAAASGATATRYFVTMWRSFITVGGLTVIVFFIWGAFEWLTAGEAGKVSKARERIQTAIIGMIILAFSFPIVGFIGQLFFGDSFDLLRLTFPTPTTYIYEVGERPTV